MSKGITIALDAMGGDFGSDVVIPAAVWAVTRYPDVTFILVGDEALLSEGLQDAGAGSNPGLKIHHASQQVEMDELLGLLLVAWAQSGPVSPETMEITREVANQLAVVMCNLPVK